MLQLLKAKVRTHKHNLANHQSSEKVFAEWQPKPTPAVERSSNLTSFLRQQYADRCLHSETDIVSVSTSKRETPLNQDIIAIEDRVQDSARTQVEEKD